MVGGATCSRRARIAATDSSAPAPPSRWPVIDFVDDTTAPADASPSAAAMACASTMSPAGVEVACALTWTTCSADSPASASALRMTRTSPLPSGAGWAM